MTTAETICAILQEHLGCDPVAVERLTEPDLLRELKADSLDMVELVFAIEEAFNVPISDDEADRFVPNDIGTTKPLSDLAAMIEGKL